MTNKPDGGPAYPTEETRYGLGEETIQHHGMTLRDYFAAQALAGDMANSEEGIFPNDAASEHLLNRTRLLYRMADAMIEARAALAAMEEKP